MVLRFALTRGAFATAVLRELIGTDDGEAVGELAHAGASST